MKINNINTQTSNDILHYINFLGQFCSETFKRDANTIVSAMEFAAFPHYLSSFLL